jgi:hypothetical protein
MIWPLTFHPKERRMPRMKEQKKPGRGGYRAGAGRKPLKEGERMEPVTIHMRQDQREKFRQLGGAAWLRKTIDEEQE